MAESLSPIPYFRLQETAMEIQTVVIIMYVVFCLFMLANWFNRPRK